MLATKEVKGREFKLTLVCGRRGWEPTRIKVYFFRKVFLIPGMFVILCLAKAHFATEASLKHSISKAKETEQALQKSIPTGGRSVTRKLHSFLKTRVSCKDDEAYPVSPLNNPFIIPSKSDF